MNCRIIKISIFHAGLVSLENVNLNAAVELTLTKIKDHYFINYQQNLHLPNLTQQSFATFPVHINELSFDCTIIQDTKHLDS